MAERVQGFTPGPWTLGAQNYPVHIEGVPNISLNLPGNDGVFITGTNQYTNALLIAAAPELLKALKAIVRDTSLMDAFRAPSSVTRYLITDAQAAIAKAEGAL